MPESPDKEAMLREVHHRVKNNLQLIASLLDLQVQFAGERSPVEVVEACRHRIMSMSVLHEKLYTENFNGKTDVKNYLGEVVANLFRSYTYKDKPVSLSCELEHGEFSVDTMVNLGLIVNELMTNSVRHGAAAQRTSKIEITGLNSEAGYLLSVRDNGRGFGYDSALKERSLGLKLVRGLASQINAQLSYTSSGGSNFEIRIPTGTVE